MEGVDSLYTEEPEEKQTEEQQQPFQLAVIATVEEDGLTLTPDGAEEPTEKHFKCNTGINFAAGQRVAVLELSGSKVVMFPIGNPGADAPAKIPPGGTAGQVLKKSSDNDYALTWGSITGLLPTGGTSGQILKKSGNADYAVEWGDMNGALPSGGTTGQVLKKSSATDYAVTWGSPDGILPTGGTDGQVLLKNGASNYAAKWGSITGALPTGGTSGQVLKKSSNTNYACTWGDVAGTLPSGGTDGQVLLKNGSTNYAAKWGTVSAAGLKSGYNSLELKTKTLTPSSNGFEIGTSSYPVTVRGDEIVLYYSSYRYCTLACNSSGKLTVNGTAIN